MNRQGANWFATWHDIAKQSEWLAILFTENYQSKVKIGVRKWLANGKREDSIPALIQEARAVIDLHKKRGVKVYVIKPETHHEGDVLQNLMQGAPSLGNFDTWKKFIDQAVEKEEADMSSNALRPGESLSQGSSISSTDNRYRLAYQNDGNLVVYGPTGALWATHNYETKGGGGRLVMQKDGNLVIYSTSGPACWSSGTCGMNGGNLVVQDDGNVVIYKDGSAVWCTCTNERRQPWHSIRSRTRAPPCKSTRC
jgi:hypothetical protein